MKEVLYSRPIVLRVLVAEGGSSVNDGLTALLSEIKGISVFGCAQTAAKVIALVDTLRPEVVILDLRTAGPFGFRVLHEIKTHPSSPVLIVLTDTVAGHMNRAITSAGADYILPKTEFDRLLEIIEGLSRNGNAYDASDE
jgi:DNA-binding NarL/FixJ family response regulator